MEARGGDQGEREVVQAHTHKKKEREGGVREGERWDREERAWEREGLGGKGRERGRKVERQSGARTHPPTHTHTHTHTH